MHLVQCARPQEPLEQAPRSGLVADVVDGEAWDGFWSGGSDDYFVRCTHTGGETEWFRMEDDAQVPVAASGADPRVLEFRSARRARALLIVAESPSGRRMLVGSTRRGPR